MNIKKRKAETEKKFDELKKRREDLIENGKKLQAQLNEVDVELTKLQGEFRLIQSLEKDKK